MSPAKAGAHKKSDRQTDGETDRQMGRLTTEEGSLCQPAEPGDISISVILNFKYRGHYNSGCLVTIFIKQIA